MSTVTITNEVADRFHGLRRSYLTIQLTIAFLVTLAVWLFGWLVLAVVDHQWELTLNTRRIALAAVTSLAAIWLVIRTTNILRNVRQGKFAGHLESKFGDFGQRIRTVLDTVSGRVDAPPEMLSALGHQTMGRWETLSPEQLLPKRSLIFSVVAAAVTGITCLSLMMTGTDWHTAMRRAIGAPVPYTHLSVTPGSTRVLEGTSVTVALTLTGRTDREVSIRHRQLTGESDDSLAIENGWRESTVSEGTRATSEGAGAARAVFEVPLGKVEQTLEYQFVTSVGDSPIHRIEVQPLIEAVEVATLVTPPAYTQLDQRRLTTKRVTVLEGSEVVISVQTSHSLRTAVLQTGPAPDKMLPTTLTPGEQTNIWKFSVPSSEAIYWNFSGEGVDGTPMTAVSGRVRIRRDAVPKIAWRSPIDGLEVHTLAEVPMAIQASDDYGLAECGIVFELGDEGEFVLTGWNQDPDAPRNTTRQGLMETLPLESFALTEQDFISYYAFAIDNREGQPQRVESDIRFLDIRQFRQYYQEQEPAPGNAMGGGGGLRIPLSEIIRRERFLVNRTRRLTKTSATDLQKQFGTIERMVENQSELAGLVRALTEFLVEQGNDDVSALNQAESLMLQASDSLAAGRFDLALIQENDALRALAETRRTLEILLARRLTRRQRQQLSRFSMQLRQKLRRERPKTDQEIADTMQQIATEQHQLSLFVARFLDQQATTSEPNTESPETTETTDTPDVESQADSTQKPAQEQGNRSDSESDRSPPADQDDVDDGIPSSDPVQRIFERQVELLERLEVISASTEAGDEMSDLIATRLTDSMQDFDQLTSAARDNSFDEYVRNGLDAADALRELAIHIETRQPGEAVSRIAKLRDLTSQLSGYEHALSTRVASPSDMPAAEEVWNPMKLDATQFAKRTAARTLTISDVLQLPVSMGDIETSEVNDQIIRFVEETEFEERLSDSRDVTERIAESQRPLVGYNESRDALNRAIEFAEIAERLDELYDELVTPRINFLRSAENRACQLQSMNASGGGKRPQNQKPQSSQNRSASSAENEDEEQKNAAGGDLQEEEMDAAERQAEMRRLQEELEAAGMQELADLLDERRTSEEDIQRMSEEQLAGNRNSSAANNESSPSNTTRLDLLINKLRDQIQQAILLEVSADRNAPVPVEYEILVDGYFRSLAEGATQE